MTADPAPTPPLSGPRLSVLACPRCRSRLTVAEDGVSCSSCTLAFPARGRILDFAPEIEHQAGLAQAFMESPTVAAVYERWFRPAFTWFVSSIRYADEDRWLDHWLGPVRGPLLEIACGTGRTTRRFARRLGPDRVLGLDLSLPMLERARVAADRAGLGELLFVRGSALALPVVDGCLDAVHCFGALHLFPDPGQAVLEIGRTLAPEGRFTCLTTIRIPGGMDGHIQDVFGRVATLRFFERDELLGYLDAADLEPLAVERREGLVLIAARRRA